MLFYFQIKIYNIYTNDDVVYYTFHSWAMQDEESWRARLLVLVSYTKQSAKLYWTTLSLHDVAEAYPEVRLSQLLCQSLIDRIKYYNIYILGQ